MAINYGATPQNYSSIKYRINWSLDVNPKPISKVENLNDFKEARQIINTIKQNIKNGK